jgi:hypothetical protein
MVETAIEYQLLEGFERRRHISALAVRHKLDLDALGFERLF